MRLKNLFLIILLLVAELAYACECFPIDSATANKLMNEVEFIIIGRAVSNVEFNPEVKDMWNQRKKGYNVLIEVDSVIKGHVDSETVIVKQFGGNCDQIFEFGKQYLIIGDQLKKFVNRTPKMRKAKKGDLPPTSEPPPPPSVHSKTVIFYNSRDKEVSFWGKIAKEHIILNTSMCSAFYVASKNARFFLGN